MNLPTEDEIRASQEVHAPLVVAYGMGVDSTAMLTEFVRRGIRPDLILFADTGGEKPQTYAYLPVIQAFLARHGFPPIQVVRKQSKLYATLEENCLRNQTLPSLAFGYKSCSLKWKVAPQDKFCNHWEPAQKAWKAGLKVVKAIGYDASPADSRRSKIQEDAKYTYWYPLREWGMTREDCIRSIEQAGLPVPVKSACFFCPASKRPELHELPPDLLARAIAMEDLARPKLGTTKGLSRGFSWRDYAEAQALILPPCQAA